MIKKGSSVRSNVQYEAAIIEYNDCRQIDKTVIKRYSEDIRSGTASSVSMMTHEYNLPTIAVTYRFRREKRSIRNWLDDVDSSGSVLDVGCGAGSWMEFFGRRYSKVIGVEQSSIMLKAPSEKHGYLNNVKMIKGDVMHNLPKGPFDHLTKTAVRVYKM